MSRTRGLAIVLVSKAVRAESPSRGTSCGSGSRDNAVRRGPSVADGFDVLLLDFVDCPCLRPNKLVSARAKEAPGVEGVKGVPELWSSIGGGAATVLAGKSTVRAEGRLALYDGSRDEVEGVVPCCCFCLHCCIVESRESVVLVSICRAVCCKDTLDRAVTLAELVWFDTVTSVVRGHVSTWIESLLSRFDMEVVRIDITGNGGSGGTSSTLPFLLPAQLFTDGRRLLLAVDGVHESAVSRRTFDIGAPSDMERFASCPNEFVRSDVRDLPLEPRFCETFVFRLLVGNGGKAQSWLRSSGDGGRLIGSPDIFRGG